MSVKVDKPCGEKILYMCPGTMIGNVRREVQHWAPHRSVVEFGGKTKVQRQFLLEIMKEQPQYVVVCNYEAWRRDRALVDDLIEVEFDTIIVDEAHNVKDRKSIAYRGIKRIISESNQGKGIPFVIPMTGTPILNRPQEFFTLLTLVDPMHFFNENYFLYDYCSQDYNTGKWKFKPGGADRLFKAFPNLFMRRTKEQAGIVLPDQTVTVHEIPVDADKYPLQAKAREQMRKWGSIMLNPESGKALTAMAAITVYTRLRQIETWPAGITETDPQTGEKSYPMADYNESQKLDEVIGWENGEVNEWGGLLPEVGYYRETGEGEAVAVYSQFVEPLLEGHRRALAAGFRSVLLYGKTSDEDRNAIAMDFDRRYTPTHAESKWDVVWCHYKVGGEGMNLTRVTQTIILDEQWNPGKRDQAYGRTDRLGQTMPNTVHVLRMKPTIDDWLANIIEEKEALIGDFNISADSLSASAFEALKNGLI